MTVYFHGNFGLNREYMAGVLKASLQNPGATGDDIAAPFGYKAPFTARYKSWLNKTGLITSNKVVELTPFGEVVWQEDPNLHSTITQWFLHNELTSHPERAEAWQYFANDFMPLHKSFSIADLRKGLSMKLMPHDSKHFGKDAPMIKVIARKMVQCYTEDVGLGQLGFLKETSGSCYQVSSPKQLGPWPTAQKLKDAYSK